MSAESGSPEGIDVERVGAWLESNVAGAQGPFAYDRIAGGRSNLTYSVTDSAGHRWALRRPPLGKALGSAHDMGREYRVVSAMAATNVPVAPIAGYCTDESVNEAPFYVMDFIEGPILRQRPDAETFPDEADRRAIGERVVDTLVAIHAVDPDEVGLGELGKKEDYVARQLRRWQGQWEGSKTREIPLVESGPRQALRAHPRAGPRRDRPRRLPARQHDPRRLRRGRRRGRLGALHARRPARRRRPPARLLGPGGRRADAALRAGHGGPRLPLPRGRQGPVRGEVRS